MDAEALRSALDRAFDHAVLHHGFADYTRDYEVLVYVMPDLRTGVTPVHLRYTFRHCVEANCRSALSAETWQRSLEDRLVEAAAGAAPEEYQWGVKQQWLYPGAEAIGDSPRARMWAEAIGIDFHEVLLRTDAHELTLVFSELDVSEVDLADAY